MSIVAMQLRRIGRVVLLEAPVDINLYFCTIPNRNQSTTNLGVMRTMVARAVIQMHRLHLLRLSNVVLSMSLLTDTPMVHLALLFLANLYHPNGHRAIHIMMHHLQLRHLPFVLITGKQTVELLSVVVLEEIPVLNLLLSTTDNVSLVLQCPLTHSMLDVPHPHLPHQYPGQVVHVDGWTTKSTGPLQVREDGRNLNSDMKTVHLHHHLTFSTLRQVPLLSDVMTLDLMRRRRAIEW